MSPAPRRRRRSGVGIQPPSMGSYIRLWAGDPTWAHPADGAAVSSWPTKGTLNSTIDQATGALQPLWRQSSINGRPAVDFDSAASQHLDKLTGVALAQPFTVVAVRIIDAAASMVIAGLANGATIRGTGISATPTARVNMGASLQVGAASVGTVGMTTYVVNGASSSVYINGALQGTGDAGALAIDHLVIGSGRNGAAYANYFDGKLGWLAVIPGDATSSAYWPAYKAWLAEHYSITVV